MIHLLNEWNESSPNEQGFKSLSRRSSNCELNELTSTIVTSYSDHLHDSFCRQQGHHPFFECCILLQLMSFVNTSTQASIT
jgi:hypothetical protein